MSAPTLYWKNAVDTHWNELGNWFTDADATIPADYIPWLEADPHYLDYNVTKANSTMSDVFISANISVNVTGICDISDNIYVDGCDVASGTWSGTNFTVNSGGSVSGGAFSASNFTVNAGGSVSGGTFSGSYFTNAAGTVHNVTLTGYTINGGIMYACTVSGGGGFVNNVSVYNTIFDGSGTFDNSGLLAGVTVGGGYTLNNTGYIYSGIFENTVNNNSGGSIFGGRFNNFLTNYSDASVYNATVFGGLYNSSGGGVEFCVCVGGFQQNYGSVFAILAINCSGYTGPIRGCWLTKGFLMVNVATGFDNDGNTIFTRERFEGTTANPTVPSGQQGFVDIIGANDILGTGLL